MTAAALVRTPEGRLRAVPRLLIFIVALFATFFVASAIEYAVTEYVAGLGYELLVTDWSVPIAILAATFVMLRWVEGRSWDFVWLGRNATNARTLLRGSLYGLLPIAATSGILLAFGQLRIVTANPGSSLGAAAIGAGNLFPAAFGEELLLRGYIFAVLRESIGARWTLISTSIVFGLLHVPNPGADAQSILLVMMAGFFLGSVLLATSSLYAVTLAHFVWNWFMAAVLHAPVSGLALATPDYRVVDNGPDWLTGGPWGPEGSVLAALGMFAVLIYLHARPLRRMES